MNQRTRKILIIVAAIALSLVLSSCIPGDGKSTPIKPAGTENDAVNHNFTQTYLNTQMENLFLFKIELSIRKLN